MCEDTTDDGLTVSGGNRIIIRGNHLINIGDIGIYLTSIGGFLKTAIVQENFLQNISSHGLRAYDAGNGFEKLIIQNYVFEGIAGDGVLTNDGAGVVDTTVLTGNVFFRILSQPYDFQSESNGVVYGNYFEIYGAARN